MFFGSAKENTVMKSVKNGHKKIAKERGFEITYNRDGTANINTITNKWINVPSNKILMVLELELFGTPIAVETKEI